jgi:hypothetical protein
MTPPPLCPHCGCDLVGVVSPCARCERDIPRDVWERWPRTLKIVALRVGLASIPTAITVYLALGVAHLWTVPDPGAALALRVLFTVGGALLVGFMGCLAAFLWLFDRWDYRGPDGTVAWVQTVVGRVFESGGTSHRVVTRTHALPVWTCTLRDLRAHPGARDDDALAAALLSAWTRDEIVIAVELRTAWHRDAHWPRAPRPDSPGLRADEPHRALLASVGERSTSSESNRFERALREVLRVDRYAIDPMASYRSPAVRAQQAWTRLDEAVSSALVADDAADAPTPRATDPRAVLSACAAKEGDAFVDEVRAAVRLALATRASVGEGLS